MEYVYLNRTIKLRLALSLMGWSQNILSLSLSLSFLTLVSIASEGTPFNEIQ